MKIRIITLFALMMACATGHAQTKEEADSLHQLGRTCASEGRLAEAKAYTKQAMDMRLKLFGEVSEDYITSLNNYALCLGMENDYAQAKQLQTRVMMLCEKLPRQHPILATFALNMGRYCYLTDDKAGAAKYWEIALPLVEKHSEVYEFLLTNLGMSYNELGDKENENRLMALMEEHNQHELQKPCDEPKCMLERAAYYSGTSNNAKAKECFLKALSMPMDTLSKIAAMEAYAKFLSGNMRDWVTAADFYMMAANTRKEQEGETEAYAKLMYQAAIYSFIGKKHQQAVDCYEVVIGFYEKQEGLAAQKNLAQTRKGMGNAYMALKQYDKARECFTLATAYYAANDSTGEDYPKIIERLATAERYAKDYEAAIGHYQEAMRLYQTRGMQQDYANAGNALYLCYAATGRTDEMDLDEVNAASREARIQKAREVIHEELGNLELTRNYLGRLAYARSLSTIAGCYDLAESYAESADYYKRYIEAVREAVRDEFRLQGETERMLTWQEERKSMEAILNLLVSLPEGSDNLKDSLATVAYDVELLSKGILLNSSIEFEKVLSQGKDDSMKSIYQQTKDNAAEIERLRQSAASDADLERIITLTQQNQQLQLQLYNGCAEYADFTQYMTYDWRDVQNALKKTDIAIEFAAIRTGALDSNNLIIALVLTKDLPSPVAINICNMTEAKAMERDEQLFDLSRNVVWSLLRQHLSGKKRIFFSADGSFNRIGIEYLAYDGKTLSEAFEVYRLSSTKELCYRHDQETPRKVALFGDIDYNDLSTESTESKRSLASMRGAGDADGDTFDNLENTLREINEIGAILKATNISDIACLTGTEASEKAFRSLDNSHVNILHIATHGTYKEERRSSDAESMASSLLAFAGANMGGATDDDGLVTAADVAAMNLRQCDLGVLSACETGLGKLGDDGVFGLQRGFKNAGVHTLLMSLKNVYDESTADMMIGFYRYLTKGISKREALVRAQRDIREAGFKDSKYWATFILLDAF